MSQLSTEQQCLQYLLSDQAKVELTAQLANPKLPGQWEVFEFNDGVNQGRKVTLHYSADGRTVNVAGAVIWSSTGLRYASGVNTRSRPHTWQVREFYFNEERLTVNAIIHLLIRELLCVLEWDKEPKVTSAPVTKKQEQPTLEFLESSDGRQQISQCVELFLTGKHFGAAHAGAAGSAPRVHIFGSNVHSQNFQGPRPTACDAFVHLSLTQEEYHGLGFNRFTRPEVDLLIRQVAPDRYMVTDLGQTARLCIVRGAIQIERSQLPTPLEWQQNSIYAEAQVADLADVVHKMLLSAHHMIAKHQLPQTKD